MRLAILLACAGLLIAQPSVYLRTSAPQGQYITNATWNGTTYQITTAAAHGYSSGNIVEVGGVCTSNDSTASGSNVNGIRKVASVIDSTDFTIQTVSGSNIANSGTYSNSTCGGTGFTGLLTNYTLASGPLGVLDGTTGPSFRRLALSTSNSNVATGLANTGSCPGDGVCVSGGVITITTTYPHGVLVTSAGGQQEYFSIWGSTSTALNTNGTYLSSTYPGQQGASYAVTGATTYTFTAAAPAGLANGDYTQNDACGSNGSTYDAINGTQNCVVVSQLAYTPPYSVITATYVSGGGYSGTLGQTCNVQLDNYWGGGVAVGTIALTGTNTIAVGTPVTLTYIGYNYTPGNANYGGNMYSGTANCNGGNSPTFALTIQSGGDNKNWDNVVSQNSPFSFTDPILYRYPFDGGAFGGLSSWQTYTNASIEFLVDQRNQNYLNVSIYNLNSVEKGSYGAGSDVNWSQYSLIGGGGNPPVFSFYIGWSVIAAWGFMSPAEQSTVLAKVYNDVYDPTDYSLCSITDNVINNNEQQIVSGATGTFGSGTSGTSFQLGSGFPSVSIVNNVIAASISGSISYGVIATYNTGTGAGTVSSWSGSSPSSGNTYVIYQSAIISATARSSQQTASTLTAGGTSSVTLNTATSTGNYVDEEIYFPALNEKAFITAYNTGTGVATITPSLSTAASSGTYYSISNAPQVTGYNSTFSSTFNVGDGINFSNSPPADNPVGTNSMVVYIASNTSMYVINSNTSGSTSTPTAIWNIPAWKSGDCGWTWQSKPAPQDAFSNATVYPTGSGGSVAAASGQGGNGPPAFVSIPHMMTDLAFVSVQSADTRPAADLAGYETVQFDYFWKEYLSGDAGWARSGNDYTWGTTEPGEHTSMWLLANAMVGSSPSMPNFDLTGPWMTAPSLFKLYAMYPDWPQQSPCCGSFGAAYPVMLNWTGGISYYNISGGFGWDSDSLFWFNPYGTYAPYLRNFAENVLGGYGTGQGAYFPQMVVQNQPTIGSTDYTTLPHQYAFSSTDYQTCQTLTGWPCPASYGQFAVVSREGWYDPNHTSHGYQTDSLTAVQFRSMTNDYDCIENGQYSLHKVGELLNNDYAGPGLCTSQNSDYTVIGNMMQFGGSNANVLNGYFAATSNATQYPTETPITEWSSANHGSWATAFGDQNSQYMRVVGDLRGAYNQNSSLFGGHYVTFNYCNRTVDELKPTGGDHFLVTWDACSTTTAQEIATHVHYPQNGETASAAAALYPEGNTTCPGSGGCSSLNTSRWVQELESGTGDGISGDPIPNYGLITNFLAPGSEYITWDGSSYSGANGHTDRVTVCAGSGSCSSSATLLESLIVHKVAESLTDTSLTTSAISTSDSHWYGAQMYGATSCAVVMEARGGTTYSSMSSFTPASSSSPCNANVQYLFGGLSPGIYTVAVGGSPVSGSPFSVAAGDNSIEFVTSLTGSVGLNQISGSALSGSAINGVIIR